MLKFGVSLDGLCCEIVVIIMVMDFILEDQFFCVFGYIFVGGYFVGYYFYKWVEVLSVDVFFVFEEVGLDQEDQVCVMGVCFCDIVFSFGGSCFLVEVFEVF